MNAIYVENVNKTFKRYVKQEGILKNFFHRQYEEKTAIFDMSFQIKQGECVAMIGQNGAGKTTLMKLLSGLLLPTTGKIEVLGYDPFKKEKEYKKKITLLLGQKQQLWWDISAQDNFILLRDIYELDQEDYKRNLDELIDMLDIGNVINNPVRTLSLGERMKCELAGSLLHKPSVLFLDEPTIGLDLIAQNDVRKFIKTYSERNQATVLLTSHNMDDIEEVCKRSIFIEKGKKYYDGTLSDFIVKYGKDGIFNIEYMGDIHTIKWEQYGEVIKKENNLIKIRIPKEKKEKIRQEIIKIEGVTHITFSELEVEEIVKEFYKKER